MPRLHQLWSGAWLGVLPRRAMDAIDEALYDLSAKYHAKEHNLEGLTWWESRAIEEHFRPGSKIMVLGVGGGREVIALRRLGFEARGWESHPELLAKAQVLVQEEGWPGVIGHAARDEVPLGTETFDAAILGWSMYMLVHGRERRIALLRAVRERLAPNGPILLSFWTRDEHDRRALRVHRVACVIRWVLRRDPPDLGDDVMPNVVHRFTQAQSREELEAAGFALVHWEPQKGGRHSSGWAVGRRVDAT